VNKNFLEADDEQRINLLQKVDNRPSNLRRSNLNSIRDEILPDKPATKSRFKRKTKSFFANTGFMKMITQIKRKLKNQHH